MFVCVKYAFLSPFTIKVGTKKNTGLFGNFFPTWGGVFPIPKTKNQKKVLDCAPLGNNDTFVLSIEIVIVLIVAGLIFVIIVICIPIIYCCIKSR